MSILYMESPENCLFQVALRSHATCRSECISRIFYISEFYLYLECFIYIYCVLKCFSPIGNSLRRFWNIKILYYAVWKLYKTALSWAFEQSCVGCCLCFFKYFENETADKRSAVVPKLLWICIWVKVIDNKTTWVRVKKYWRQNILK